MSGKSCVKINVIGHVQGVGFRDFAKKQAQSFQVEGLIQNLDDNKVSISACGLSDALDKFIEQIYKGPKKSSVQNVEVEPISSHKDFRGVFRIIE